MTNYLIFARRLILCLAAAFVAAGLLWCIFSLLNLCLEAFAAHIIEHRGTYFFGILAVILIVMVIAETYHEDMFRTAAICVVSELIALGIVALPIKVYVIVISALQSVFLTPLGAGIAVAVGILLFFVAIEFIPNFLPKFKQVLPSVDLIGDLPPGKSSDPDPSTVAQVETHPT